MKNVIAKIIRCVNMNCGKAFFLWHLEYKRTKEMEAIIRKNRILSNFGIMIQKKYNQNLKSGVRVLADGVALTKAQNAVFN